MPISTVVVRNNTLIAVAVCLVLTALVELDDDGPPHCSAAFMTLIFSALRTFGLTDPEYTPFPLRPQDAYWAYCVQMGNMQFKTHFRMTRRNFDRLCVTG